MAAVMADTSVRSWGNMTYGAGGAGAQAIGRTFPTRVAFPPGTPRITKMVGYWEGMFFLDATGAIWHTGLNTQGVSGLGSDSPIPRRINGSGDLGTNTKIVDIFVGCDYYDYAQAAAIDDAGRVYIWGSNRYQSNGIPGLTATTNPVPRLVPFTENTPIKQVFLGGSYYQATYLLSETGMLYVAGQEDAAGPGGSASITEHRLFMPWGDDKPVKLVQTSESDRHTVDGAQYYNRVYCVVLENGDLYAWGYGGNEVQGGARGSCLQAEELKLYKYLGITHVYCPSKGHYLERTG
jgi:alpha-tubulin suppressor-like RCC1 family protein